MQPELELKYGSQWNLGAFLLPGLWAIAHEYVWIGIAFLIVDFIPTIFPQARIEIAAVLLAGHITMGFKANKMALVRRQFSSEQDFVRCQEIWRNAAFGIIAVFVLLLIFRITLTRL